VRLKVSRVDLALRVHFIVRRDKNGKQNSLLLTIHLHSHRKIFLSFDDIYALAIPNVTHVRALHDTVAPRRAS